jgi:hypothetical protein
MPRKPVTKSHDPEQSKRFIDAALEAEAHETEEENIAGDASMHDRADSGCWLALATVEHRRCLISLKNHKSSRAPQKTKRAHGPYDRSSNRKTPGAFGFLILSQTLLGPDRYGGSRCFETMPSRPNLQACVKMAAPSPSRCSLYLTPAGALAMRLRQSGLALLKRPRSPVLTVGFEQVEGVEKHLIVVGSAMQLFEHGHARVVAADRLAVDRGRVGANRGHSLGNERIALGPIIAAAREQAYPVIPLARDQAIAVVFDFVYPLRSDRRL